MALDNVYQAGRYAGISKVQDKIFDDQLLPHVNRLQQYCQSSSENKSTACSLQEEALRAIYRIYSLKLRPANLLETSSEIRLQNQLLELINQPYGIHDDSSNPSAVPTIEDPNSPFWNLHDWSLKLIRFLIENGHLSAETNKIVEDHFIKVLETIQGCQLKGQACPSTSKNIAIIAHCLCKIFQINKHTGSTQRRLLSPGFICDHLFPLASEFAAKEYPASILDPINYYARFESSGKLVEPDEALIEWNRRNKRKTAPETSDNSSKRIKFEHEYSDRKEDVDPLPPAHVCLEHLIYELTVSSNQTDQDVIVMFLQNILNIRYQPNGDSIDSSRTASDILMNKIVALHVFGRLKLNPIWGVQEISFLKEFVLPNLKHDCLLLKICKFQLVRFLMTDDIEQRIELARAFLDEFIKVIEREYYQDGRNKLFITFASVASECLYRLQGSDEERLKSSIEDHLQTLAEESKLTLVSEITRLYLDFKIVAPLALVDIMYMTEEQSTQFYINIERAMTDVIDSIAAELLAISPDSDRAKNLSRHLYTATNLREILLPAATADRLIRLAKISSNDVHRRAFFECALMNPLKEQTKLLATEMLDRLLENLSADDTRTATDVAIILGNHGYHQVTSLSSTSISNNSATSSRDMHDERRSRNPLFGSHKRIRDILAWCEQIERESHMTSSWLMSILISWPSPRQASVIEPPDAAPSFNSTWKCFVDSAIGKANELDLRKTLITTPPKKNDDQKEYVTFQNLLFAIMAAINSDPERLEDRGQSHTSVYVKIWLDFVNGKGDDYIRPDCEDPCFMQRSHVVISYQALINIHQAQTAGKLDSSIKRLTHELNSARKKVLEWLSVKAEHFRQHSKEMESPLERFYDHSIQQLEAIGSFE